MKKLLSIILGIILALLIAVGCIWGKEIGSVASIKSVEDNPYLYTMDYKASYDLDDLLSHDIDGNAKLGQYVANRIGKGLFHITIKSNQLADENGEYHGFGCTSFQALKADATGYWYGRNYDYFKNPTLVVTSHPKKGYASISCCDMSHFGFGLDKLPTRLTDKFMCLAAIYTPLDGVNEKGLCMSIMALPKQAARQETGKHKAATSVLIRLVLDRCATVEEAVELIRSVDVRHDTVTGGGYHYMVADAQGHAAVVEFDLEDGWKTLVVPKDTALQYMTVTNHLLSPKFQTEEPNPKYGNPYSRSWWRYDTVEEYLSQRNGTLTLQQAQECLGLVHWVDLAWGDPKGTIEDTQYSNVYDQTNHILYLRNWNNYDHTYQFQLLTSEK